MFEQKVFSATAGDNWQETNEVAYFSFSCEIYRRLDRLAKKASTITWSMVSPALRHLKQKNNMDNYQSKWVFFFISIYRRACVWPADVIDGNVSELLIHGRLVFSTRQEIEGGLRVLIGDIYPNFSRALKIVGETYREYVPAETLSDQ